MPSRLDAVLLANFALEIMRRRAIGRERRIGIPDRNGTDRDVPLRIIRDRRQQASFAAGSPQPGQQQQPAAPIDTVENVTAKLGDIEDRNRRDRQWHGVVGHRERHRVSPPRPRQPTRRPVRPRQRQLPM